MNCLTCGAKFQIKNLYNLQVHQHRFIKKFTSIYKLDSNEPNEVLKKRKTIPSKNRFCIALDLQKC
jgi:hypothetical protein